MLAILIKETRPALLVSMYFSSILHPYYSQQTGLWLPLLLPLGQKRLPFLRTSTNFSARIQHIINDTLLNRNFQEREIGLGEGMNESVKGGPRTTSQLSVIVVLVFATLRSTFFRHVSTRQIQSYTVLFCKFCCTFTHALLLMRGASRSRLGNQQGFWSPSSEAEQKQHLKCILICFSYQSESIHYFFIQARYLPRSEKVSFALFRSTIFLAS